MDETHLLENEEDDDDDDDQAFTHQDQSPSNRNHQSSSKKKQFIREELNHDQNDTEDDDGEYHKDIQRLKASESSQQGIPAEQTVEVNPMESRKRRNSNSHNNSQSSSKESQGYYSTKSSPDLQPPFKVPKNVLVTSSKGQSHSSQMSPEESSDSSSSGHEHTPTKRHSLLTVSNEKTDLLNISQGNTSRSTPSSFSANDDEQDDVVNGMKRDENIVVASNSHQRHDHYDDDDNNYVIPDCDESFLAIVNLERIPWTDPLPILTPRQLSQLELALQIGDKYSDFSDRYFWPSDWSGNLQLMEKDIVLNREELAKNPEAEVITLPFCEWVATLARHSDDFLAAEMLFSFVYHMNGTPPMAKRILSYYLRRPANSVPERLKYIVYACRRISHDPNVLVQDGWSTTKSDVPDGIGGGTYFIGRRVICQQAEAIVIAFVRDENIGDLWKCMWIDDNDTFDLEADELQEAMELWEKRVTKKKNSRSSNATSTRGLAHSNRFEVNRNFTVDGIEGGIVIAKTYNVRGARPWPARIMHVSEIKKLGLGPSVTARRSSSKNEIYVVFLAPYWNAKVSKSEDVAPSAKDSFSTGSLFEVETIDVSPETVMKYPYSTESGMLNIDRMRNEFSFLGLPKAAFNRFLDSHRIAIALKAYSEKCSSKSGLNEAINAMSSLTDTHPFSIRTFKFPDALLNIPFDYILSNYPDPTERKINEIIDKTDELVEPIMRLDQVLKSIAPPHCWSQKPLEIISPNKIKPSLLLGDSIMSPEVKPWGEEWSSDNFASETLMELLSMSSKDYTIKILDEYLSALVKGLNAMVSEAEKASDIDKSLRQSRLSSFLLRCLLAKSIGEDQIFTLSIEDIETKKVLIIEWRKTCERIFRRAVIRMGHLDFGNGVTAVLSDSRCNEHITAKGSYERPVRLPAAIKGAKRAGAGSTSKFPLINKIENSYLELAENTILPMAHKESYLKKMKDKILGLDPSMKGAPLTDDSDGEGGDDTRGSRGSFAAAVTGVAAALKGVDMVVTGKCVNVFCAIRPPGHHAGRDIHPMKAVSNGFCILNAAASAALYAASPRSQGGLGLKRVCVIDIDVHHGNGTQDILCSTYDPRFLYISTHAGGAHVNGFRNEDDADADLTLFRRGTLSSADGIFPGKCGDISPHPGVLNIPLGTKVTSSALGTALVTQVSPAVERFDPDLIIISAGFDAHVNDPMGMGGLSAKDFGTVTSVICQMALRCCSGRVISVLEGGYGVPCCIRLAEDLFLPKGDGQQPSQKILDLGEDLPADMDDIVDPVIRSQLDKCHQEGFLQCVQSHVSNLNLHNDTEGGHQKVQE